MKQTILSTLNKYNAVRDKLSNKIKPPIIVLMYHRVLSENKESSPFIVTTQNFKKQINYLKNNFKILKFDDDWSDVDTPSFVITFDDGYYDNYVIARDFLDKESIPSTFFISTNNIDTNRLFWWDEISIHRDCYEEYTDLTFDALTRKLIYSTPEQQVAFLSKYRPHYKKNTEETDTRTYRSMTKKELYELSQFKLVTIGNHTVNHTKLTLLNDEEVLNEILESKKTIEEIINKKVSTFSFPYGSYNKNIINICRKIGLKKVATTVSRNYYSWTNTMKIPRVHVADDDINDFKIKIEKLLS